MSSSDQGKSDTSSKEDSEKRKRTVHIDVYCTGNETSDSSSSGEEFEKPNLICYAGKNVQITHEEIKNNSILPRGFQDDKAFLKRAAERRCESFRHAPMRMPSLTSSKGYESDDVLSSLYPSQFSSYSALRDSWSSSISTMALEDSSSATSWKDTISDIDSHRITPCDSIEFSDQEKKRTSFIDKSKTWKSPQTERRHLLQNRKIKEYMDKHRVDWTSEESNSDDSDVIAWSFLSSDDHTSTIKERKNSPEIANIVHDANSEIRKPSPPSLVKVESLILSPIASRITSPTSFRINSPSTSRITSPFTSRVTSPISRVTSPFTSRVTSPFTTNHGEKTDHIIKASVFGRVVAAFKKPGHHIGPAKNPSCSCDHCRRYFEERSKDRFKSFFDFDRRSSSQLSRVERDSTRASSRN